MPSFDDMPVLDRLRAAAIRLEKTADAGPGRLLMAGGAGALAAGIPIAMLMHAHEQEARTRARNVGFGAGAAAGLATPAIVRGLYDMTRGPTS